MELLVLGLLVAVGVWYGVFRPVETLAKAADDEIQVLVAERKADHVKTLKGLSLTDEDVLAAKSNLDRLRSIEL